MKAMSRAIASTDTVTGVRTTLAYATVARKVTTQAVSYAETTSTILFDANGRELSRETTMSLDFRS